VQSIGWMVDGHHVGLYTGGSPPPGGKAYGVWKEVSWEIDISDEHLLVGEMRGS
jgi:hypothetical protein